MKNRDENKNTITHRKIIRDGLTIYKKPKSKYWIARIYIPNGYKYTIRSTKETNRLDAIEVAKEIANKIIIKDKNSIPKNYTFKSIAEDLMQNQKLLSGKSKSLRYAYDDASLMNRKKDGLIAYFGNMDIREINTYDIRKYLNVLDKNRDSVMSASSKSKYCNILSKIFKLADEKQLIERLPLIPNPKKVDVPRPSFTEKEYKKVLKTTKEIVKKKINVRGIPLTEEMYLFIVFMTHTFLRPVSSEIFAIKHKDIEVVNEPKHLRIRLQNGKTGFRIVHTLELAVDFYNKLYELNSPLTTQNDYIFQPTYKIRRTAMRNMQRQFNYILEKCDLKTTDEGQTRVAYSLRHYALQTRLRKRKGKVNIFTLAKNAGTSVNQLERFYLKNLELDEESVKNLQTY